MRARDLDRLTVSPYDVLVVGGGIHGLAIAYEAASRGLRTALIEAADFGGGTSFNHQKTAHGGLRSLQSGRLDKALDAVRERRALARIAPWLLRPQPFLLGTYRSPTRSRLALRAAFRVDSWIGRRRNDGVEAELHLPAPRLLSRAATSRLFAGINQHGLTGGAQWYDYQMVEADRLTLAFAEAADRSGADVANYAEAVAARRSGPRVTGMAVRDVLTGRMMPVEARAVVNAAGAGVAGVTALFGDPRDVPMLKAMNVMTTIPAGDIALAAPAASGRMLTLVPWRGRALVGTSQSALVARDAAPTASAAEVEAFIAEVNSAFPALGLTLAQVALVHRGIVPAVTTRSGRAELRPTADVIDHAPTAPGAFSVVGVKYTTARGVAERVVDLVARRSGTKARPSHTGERVLPGAAIADHEALAIEAGRRVGIDLAPATLRHLTSRYAERAAVIVELMAQDHTWGPLADAATPVVGAEVVHAIRFEMAVRLSDIVIRRTGLGAAGHPGTAIVAACAQIAAREFGWTAERVQQEIIAVDAFYRIAENPEPRTSNPEP